MRLHCLMGCGIRRHRKKTSVCLSRWCAWPQALDTWIMYGASPRSILTIWYLNRMRFVLLRRNSDNLIFVTVTVKVSSRYIMLQRVLLVTMTCSSCQKLVDLVVSHVSNLLFRMIGFEASSACVCKRREFMWSQSTVVAIVSLVARSSHWSLLRLRYDLLRLLLVSSRILSLLFRF